MGVTPMSGPVVVTGAAGGVGSGRGCNSSPPWAFRSRAFDRAGRREGRLPERLGPQPRSSKRKELAGPRKNPLEKSAGAGGIDTVGSTHARQRALDDALLPRGRLAACGLAGGMDLPTFGRAVFISAQCFAFSASIP